MRFRQHRGPDGLGSPCTDGGRLPGIKFFPSGKKRSVLILAQQYGIEVIRGWACGVRMLFGRREASPQASGKSEQRRPHEDKFMVGCSVTWRGPEDYQWSVHVWRIPLKNLLRVS